MPPIAPPAPDKKLCNESQNRWLLVFVAEFLGTLFFTFLPTLNNNALTNATALALWVYFSSHTSSAHLNPALTLAFVLLGHHRPSEIVVYIPAQVSGALVGATFAKYLVPNSQGLGCFVPLDSLNGWQVFGIELLLTMSFIVGVFTVVFYTKDKLGFGNLGPLLIGLALFANAQAGGALTGAPLNPARVIASPIVIGCQGNNLIHAYILGELLGAVGAFVITFVFFGINMDGWYVKWLKEDHAQIVPAFNYTLRHDQAPMDLRRAHDQRLARTPSLAARRLDASVGSRPVPGTVITTVTPESQTLLDPVTPTPKLGPHFPPARITVPAVPA